MFTDYHVHTEYSDDAFYPMEDAVRDAVAMGWKRSALRSMWITG